MHSRINDTMPFIKFLINKFDIDINKLISEHFYYIMNTRIAVGFLKEIIKLGFNFDNWIKENREKCIQFIINMATINHNAMFIFIIHRDLTLIQELHYVNLANFDIKFLKIIINHGYILNDKQLEEIFEKNIESLYYNHFPNKEIIKNLFLIELLELRQQDFSQYYKKLIKILLTNWEYKDVNIRKKVRMMLFNIYDRIPFYQKGIYTIIKINYLKFRYE